MTDACMGTQQLACMITMIISPITYHVEAEDMQHQQLHMRLNISGAGIQEQT